MVQRSAVGRCMSALGWARGRRRNPGGLHWVYVRPGTGPVLTAQEALQEERELLRREKL